MHPAGRQSIGRAVAVVKIHGAQPNHRAKRTRPGKSRQLQWDVGIGLNSSVSDAGVSWYWSIISGREKRTLYSRSFHPSAS